MQGCEAQKRCLTFEPRDRNGGLSTARIGLQGICFADIINREIRVFGRQIHAYYTDR